MDLAGRAYNHTFNMDPIVRSLLDTDFYKLAMHQLIWHLHSKVRVTFAFKNRTTDVRLADIIPIEAIKEQLEHCTRLRFQPQELILLAGTRFYGRDNVFCSEYLKDLANFSLSNNYHIEATNDGQYKIEFYGTWFETTLWEIHCLNVVNTLRNRYQTKALSRFQFEILYARAQSKLWNKLNFINDNLETANITDFGTRRRWDFLFQEWAVQAAQEVLGDKFTGTSNVFLAMKHGLEAKGTNAHELPMVYAALSNSDEELKQSQYKVLEDWKHIYNGNMLIALPDTFGTTQFYENAPDWFWAEFKGSRWDSKEPKEAGDEQIAFLIKNGQDPMNKLGIASDGLDAKTIVDINRYFKNRMLHGDGWGTLLTNDFRGCDPRGTDMFVKPISAVCKAASAQAPGMDRAQGTVKLSDNYAKAMGSAEDIARYRRVFGTKGQANIPTIV